MGLLCLISFILGLIYFRLARDIGSIFKFSERFQKLIKKFSKK
jgi:hypothetical protein